jgi:pimeloyl-ACP methyl ester carboxylesterase
MPHKASQNPADYIVPLNINGLDGRMLRAPSIYKSRQREILLVYGHHALLERWWSLVQNLQSYGNVTMPDLPGFGGMDSFQTIGRKPDVDAFADYLAAFVKLRYRRKRVTIVAISFGFVVATRMLQKYPELVKKVDLLTSIVGFMHHDDFIYSPRAKYAYRMVTRLFATRPFAFFIRYTAYNKRVLTFMYSNLPNSKRKMIEVTPEEFNDTIDMEVKIWQANDVRTHWLTTSEFFTLDNCQTKVNLPLAHVASEADHYFNNEIVKQHMLVVFKGYEEHVARSKAHTPSILADKKTTGVLLPPGLRKQLAKKLK